MRSGEVRSSKRRLQMLRSLDLQVMLQVDRVTIWRMVQRGALPRPVRLAHSDGHPRWVESDVLAYIEKQVKKAQRG